MHVHDGSVNNRRVSNVPRKWLVRRTKVKDVHRGTRSPDRHDEEVGRRLRARRLEQELSQTELGEQIGVTFQQLQKYEKGVNRIGAGRLQRAAEVLRVPITFFFDDAAPVRKRLSESLPPTAFEFLKTSNAMRLVKAFSRIRRPVARRAFIEICELFAYET